MAKLGPRERRRFVRHILLPEVGVSGQERLLEASFARDGSPSHEVAARYLSRAGLAEGSEGEPLPVCPFDDPVDAALAGAWLAVERIKASLGVGRPAPLPALLRPDSSSSSGE
ncbi:MAG: hypothetical protein H6722_23700 [Sandaracinus sp.]|nr:hypothetical protein [Sandaracinus sp.]MCB9615448.1 hypothetical protein [Sandaracinus sp.]MCB9622621.1 hypothetical protein [Sandaracinus sp.]